jgi:hypothetical protein
MLVMFFFFAKHSTNADAHIHACNSTPISISERLIWQILEIDEVSTNASLSTGKSSPTKKIAPVKSRINSEKYEHLY